MSFYRRQLSFKSYRQIAVFRLKTNFSKNYWLLVWILQCREFNFTFFSHIIGTQYFSPCRCSMSFVVEFWIVIFAKKMFCSYCHTIVYLNITDNTAYIFFNYLFVMPRCWTSAYLWDTLCITIFIWNISLKSLHGCLSFCCSIWALTSPLN